MKNNILALIIMAAGIIGVWGNVGKNAMIALLGVIAAVLLFVSVESAQASNFGPATGLIAFVLSFAVVVAFRRRK